MTMTREEAHTLLEIMAINLTGAIANSKDPVTEQTKLMAKQIEAIDMAIEALQFAEHFDLLKEYQSLQEVVRCKDCRHYEDGMVGYCWEVDRGVSGDFFCAYGERKEPKGFVADEWYRDKFGENDGK